ncbi:hypothetical protein NQZ68_000402, partial [Dissostichus eleginoides]
LRSDPFSVRLDGPSPPRPAGTATELVLELGQEVPLQIRSHLFKFKMNDYAD